MMVHGMINFRILYVIDTGELSQQKGNKSRINVEIYTNSIQLLAMKVQVISAW